AMGTPLDVGLQQGAFRLGQGIVEETVEMIRRGTGVHGPHSRRPGAAPGRPELSAALRGAPGAGSRRTIPRKLYGAGAENLPEKMAGNEGGLLVRPPGATHPAGPARRSSSWRTSFCTLLLAV